MRDQRLPVCTVSSAWKSSNKLLQASVGHLLDPGVQEGHSTQSRSCTCRPHRDTNAAGEGRVCPRGKVLRGLSMVPDAVPLWETL